MLTGNLGKPHAGVNPVRGQNNVQGACDMGALPDTYPGYQYVKDPANREKFAKAWGVESLPAHTVIASAKRRRTAQRMAKCVPRTLWAKIRCKLTRSCRQYVKPLKIWNWLSFRTSL